MPAASAAPVTTGSQQLSRACSGPAHVRGCARYGQRGPDEETEMNFMSARQCPAVKATRTARWCQHRKVCFQVPMHFATDAPHVRVNQSESRLALFSSQCNSIRQLRKENPPRLAGYPGPESSALSDPALCNAPPQWLHLRHQSHQSVEATKVTKARHGY